MERVSFVRPMLNSSVRGSTVDAELFINRAVARLDASRQANLITEYLCVKFVGLNFNERLRLLKIWQSLQARYGTAL
jgi:hypothetical protein